MKCPYCGTEMILGHIQPLGLRATFWIPENVSVKEIGFFLTVDGVRKVGGYPIGVATNIGFFSAQLADSFLCEQCKFLITKL